MSEYIQITGKNDIYIGDSDYSGTPTIYKVGEQEDDTRLEVRTFTIDVPGDRHGGPQGPPIERQRLGQIAMGTMNLSRFDPSVLQLILQHRTFATNGKILQSEIGSLTFLERAFRILIKPVRSNDPGTDATITAYDNVDPYVWNFVCCDISNPITLAQGTKYARFQFSFEAHRAPEGHNKEYILWDRDTAGLA